MKLDYDINSSLIQELPQNHTLFERKIFQKMFSPQGLNMVEPYLKEEENILENYVLANIYEKIQNIIVIGAGPLRYLEIASLKNYIAIDKYLDSFLNKNLKAMIKGKKNISLINKSFEVVEPNELPAENSLYIFTFNVISYINDLERSINKLIGENNIIFISGWNKMAHSLMSNYLHYVYQSSPYLKNSASFIDPHKINFTNMDKIKKIEKHGGIFTKSISIYM